MNDEKDEKVYMKINLLNLRLSVKEWDKFWLNNWKINTKYKYKMMLKN